MAKKTSKSKTLPIYVLNGPNLNLLGSREPEIYGTHHPGRDRKGLRAARAKSHGFAIVFRQSNQEGELVDLIQEARSKAAGVILNAAGYTHTSVAMLDALQDAEAAGDRSASVQPGAARGISATHPMSRWPPPASSPAWR